MKSKLFWGFCTALVASLPLSALADTNVKVDYKGGALKYQLIPGILPDRTLPKAFDYPILTNIAVDNSITTNTPITDAFNPPAIPQGVTAEDVIRIRSEYTKALAAWGESIKECVGKKPNLLRVSTNNPVLFNDAAGTIVRNANYKAVCK
jgi:hypothetical protein